MGIRRRRGPARPSRGQPLSAIVRVVPDVPSFSVDDGFRYASGDLDLEVGAQVRVPLGGRRTRGWVIDQEEGSLEGLREVVSRSGSAPVFDRRTLVTLRWAAGHYVAPLSVLLGKSAPPNLPRRAALPGFSEVQEQDSPLPVVTSAAAAGRHARPHYLLAPPSWPEALLGLSRAVLARDRSVMAVFPTVAEAGAAAATVSRVLGDRVVLATGKMHDRDVTSAWQLAAQHRGTLLIGTPRILLWPVAALSLAVVVEEGRRGHKDRQTPTLHSREILRRRSTVERFPLVFMGRVPTTELVANGTPVVGPARSWPLVEIVDRRADPSLGLFTDHVRAVIQGAVNRNQRVFVFTHRHGFAPAFLCAQCRSLRVCERCDSRLDRDGTCARCGHHQLNCLECAGRRFVPLGAGTGRITAELGRFVDRSKVGAAGAGRTVEVGTERDLPGVTDVDVAIAVDADGLLMGSNYRAGEDALRVLARLTAVVGRGRGRRSIVQTTRPDHPVITALRRGDPMEFLDLEVASRAAYHLPPAGEVIVLEVTNPPSWAVEEIAALAHGSVTVLGPASVIGTHRWLLQGSDLASVRDRLRGIAHRLRDAHATVRIDVDPIEL